MPEGITWMSFFNEYIQWSKYCPILSENVGLGVPNRNFRDFSLCNVDFKIRDCPSARCASAVNAIDSDTGIFSGVRSGLI